MLAFQIRNSGGIFPECGSFLNFSGKGLAFTALKPSEDEKALVFRVCNVTDEASVLELAVPDGCVCRLSNIIEPKGDLICANETGKIHVPVEKKEIKSLRIELSRYE